MRKFFAAGKLNFVFNSIFDSFENSIKFHSNGKVYK